MASVPSSISVTPLLILSLLSDPSAKSQLWGTVVAATTYGVVLGLSGKCIGLLIKTRYIYATQMRRFLFIYVIGMLLLSTVTMVEEIVYLRYRLLRGNLHGDVNVGMGFVIPDVDSANVNFKQLFLSDIPLTMPMAIWGADGFMLWRCLMLYNGASWPVRWALYSLLGVLVMVSLAAGILFFFSSQISVVVKSTVDVGGSISSKSILSRSGLGEVIYSPLLSWVNNGDGVTFSIGATPVCNAVLAALVVGRLLYHQRYLRKVFGVGHGSAYTRVIAMCIESCALIIANSVLYLGLFYTGLSKDKRDIFALANGFPLLILPHICVISPILIVARVAEGKVETLPPPEVASQMASIAFAVPFSAA